MTKRGQIPGYAGRPGPSRVSSSSNPKHDTKPKRLPGSRRVRRLRERRYACMKTSLSAVQRNQSSSPYHLFSCFFHSFLANTKQRWLQEFPVRQLGVVFQRDGWMTVHSLHNLVAESAKAISGIIICTKDLELSQLWKHR